MIATVLAIISLADLFDQLIKWAKKIHWIVERYHVAKVWLFSWSPLHIPPEWHDVIVLLAILFSVTNVGFYQRMGRTYLGQLFRVLRHIPRFTLTLLNIRASLAARRRNLDEFISAIGFERNNAVYWTSIAVMGLAQVVALGFAVNLGLSRYFGWNTVLDENMIFKVTEISILVMLIAYSGAFIAWRWILTTAALFVALVAVNEIYVRWLEPLAGH